MFYLNDPHFQSNYSILEDQIHFFIIFYVLQKFFNFKIHYISKVFHYDFDNPIDELEISFNKFNFIIIYDFKFSYLLNLKGYIYFRIKNCFVLQIIIMALFIKFMVRCSLVDVNFKIDKEFVKIKVLINFMFNFSSFYQ
jgi:hypothetical protein